jgi:hypothetical protein
MQEREELRALKREIKMLREGRVKGKNMCMEKKKEKNRRVKRMKESD